MGSDDLMTVPVTLPARVWGRLASLADASGVTVADLVADAIQDVLPVRAPRPFTRAADIAKLPELRVWVAEGVPMSHMAKRAGCSDDTLRNALRLAGLSVERKGRK